MHIYIYIYECAAQEAQKASHAVPCAACIHTYIHTYIHRYIDT